MTALSHLFRWALAWSQQSCAHHWVHREWAWCDCRGNGCWHALMWCPDCTAVACAEEDID